MSENTLPAEHKQDVEESPRSLHGVPDRDDRNFLLDGSPPDTRSAQNWGADLLSQRYELVSAYKQINYTQDEYKSGILVEEDERKPGDNAVTAKPAPPEEPRVYGVSEVSKTSVRPQFRLRATDPKAFGEDLEAARKRAKVKPTEMAARLDIQYPNYRRMERGDGGIPSHQRLNDIAKALGRPIFLIYPGT